MSLFFSETEQHAFAAFRREHRLGQDVFWALRLRALERAKTPGLHGNSAEAEWWFVAGEYLSDAAMAHVLKPGEPLATWLRDAVLSIIRRPADDWVGPVFRDHDATPPRGHLETGHLSWGVSVALDLAPDVFQEAERAEIRAVLRERAIPMCLRWLDANTHMANWRCVLTAGIAVAAAVLDDRETLERAAKEYRLCLKAFQEDGSYSESLQYGNYAAFSLMLVREALVRRDANFAETLPITPQIRLPRWQAASLLYRKPLSGWGSVPRARCANFNDSAALFRPSGDLLLHFAARGKESHPVEAGLARWLFDQLYAEDVHQPPHDVASFGFMNDYGFLTPVLLPEAAAALSPVEARLPETLAFDNGDVLARDAWDGDTVLAVHGGGEGLNGPGHLHGDLNSFILVHRRERLLLDPGHSCYRNLIHGLEGSSLTHNTCTFEIYPGHTPGLQEDRHRPYVLEQSRYARRHIDPVTYEPEPPADRGARRLLVTREGDVTMIGSEAAALYGPQIRSFARYWILCGAHALFVVDRIESRDPVRVRWHWLFNNRDGELNVRLMPPDRLVARRGGAGMKLIHLGDGRLQPTPQCAYVHDSYHPQPGQHGEGKPGSGMLYTIREPAPKTARTVVHAMAMDSLGGVAGWHLLPEADGPVWESPDQLTRWQLLLDEAAGEMSVRELLSGRQWDAVKLHTPETEIHLKSE